MWFFVCFYFMFWKITKMKFYFSYQLSSAVDNRLSWLIWLLKNINIPKFSFILTYIIVTTLCSMTVCLTFSLTVCVCVCVCVRVCLYVCMHMMHYCVNCRRYCGLQITIICFCDLVMPEKSIQYLSILVAFVLTHLFMFKYDQCYTSIGNNCVRIFCIIVWNY